jgi:hypothetical protein
VIIVRRGRWLYAGSAEQPVDVVGLPYDFWFELAEADEQLEPGETAQELGDDGLLYYARFRLAGETSTPTWPDSGGYPTIDEAMSAAQERVPTVIRWEPAGSPTSG